MLSSLVVCRLTGVGGSLSCRYAVTVTLCVHTVPYAYSRHCKWSKMDGKVLLYSVQCGNPSVLQYIQVTETAPTADFPNPCNQAGLIPRPHANLSVGLCRGGCLLGYPVREASLPRALTHLRSIDGVPSTSRKARATARRTWPRQSETRESRLCVIRSSFGGLISKSGIVASQRAVVLWARQHA